MRPVVLSLVDYYLPGFKAGGPITTIRNMVARLQDEFEFSIVTRDRDLGDSAAYRQIQPHVWQTVEDARGFKPRSLALQSRDLAQELPALESQAASNSGFETASNICYLRPGIRGLYHLRKLLQNSRYDVLYLNSFFSPLFSIYPLLLRREGQIPKRPVVLAPRGELCRGALRLKRWKKLPFIRAARLLNLDKDVVWHASCPEEAAAIHSWIGRQATVKVAPDLPTVPTGDRNPHWERKQSGRLRVLFLSRVCVQKNLHGALQILSGLKGQVELNIVGPLEDPQYWQRCQNIIRRLPSNIQVRYAGCVTPDKVSQVMQNHDLFFLPTFSENFGHVILEALCAGCPVLISDQTPWRGLEAAGAGWDLPLNRVEKFRSVLQQVVDVDDGGHRKFSENASTFGHRFCLSESVVEQNRTLFVQAMSAVAN